MREILIMHIHATSQNKGDEALLTSVLKLLDNLEIKIIDVCTETESHSKVVKFLNVKNISNLFQFFSFISYLRKCDAVLLGGGDVITASNNLLLLAIARILKAPVFCVGVGVNLKHVSKLSMFFLKYGIQNVSAAFIRDTNSSEKMLELGLNVSKLIQVSDLTFAHGARSLAPGYKDELLDLPEKYIAVSMRAPEFNSSKWGDKEYRNIAMGLDTAIYEHKLKVVFVSMADEYKTVTHIEGNKDEYPDSLVCQKIQEYMEQKKETMIVESAASIDQIMSIFDRATVSICCRLHAKIFSTLVGTPFIGLTYNLKSDAFMKDAGMHDFCLPIQDLEASSLSTKITWIFDNYVAATNRTSNSCSHLANKAAAYSKLSVMINKTKPRSYLRLLDPKLWAVYITNYMYEVYTKYSR